MRKEYQAMWDGQDTTAEKRNGQWYIGGDKAPGDEDILILLERDDRPAWFRLEGCVLSFSDYD